MDQSQQEPQPNNQQIQSDCKSMQSHILQYQSTQIEFPQLPQEYDAIYDIYSKGKEKMHKLRAKVQQLQMQILEMERARDDTKSLQDEGVILLQQDLEEGNQLMINYEKQCNKREEQLRSLDEIYTKLKRIYTEESILNNVKLKENIIKHIEEHREVKQYKAIHQFIIMLNKEIMYHDVVHEKNIANHLMPQQNQLHLLSRSHRSDSHSNKKGHRSEDFREEKSKIKSVSYGIKIINTQNLFNRFIHKFIVEDELNQGQMMKMKQSAQKQVNAAISISINSKSDFNSIEYNLKRQEFYILDQENAIYVVKLNEQCQNTHIKMDKCQKIIYLRSINDRLWIGSNKGILKQYLIQSSQITISKIYACFNKQKQEINNYFIFNHNENIKIMFNIRQILFQISATYQISQVTRLSSKILYTINDFMITEDHIYQCSIKENKIGVGEMKKLDQWYKEQKEQNKRRIVHIKRIENKDSGMPQKKQLQKDRFSIIMADSFGNFSQLFT